MIVRVVLASWMLLCAIGIQAEEPKWLTDARAREGKIGTAKEFKSKDSWFRARVPGKVKGAVEKVEDSYSIEVDFGGESGAYCELVPDGFDMADMMRRTLELTMQQVAENQGKLESRQLEYADAGAIGNLPYLKARWIYRVQRWQGTPARAVQAVRHAEGRPRPVLRASRHRLREVFRRRHPFARGNSRDDHAARQRLTTRKLRSRRWAA